MPGGYIGPSMTPALAAMVASALLASDDPKSEGTAPAPGTGEKAARDDHVHQRLTITRNGDLDANGSAVIDFAPVVYDLEPGFFAVSIGAAALVGFDVLWAKNAGGKYIGATITGRRSRKLPAVIGLLTALLNYDTSEPAANVRFNATIIKSSQAPA